MAKVGFDLDGIICPDINMPFFLREFDLSWRVARNFQRPLFRPLIDAIIVTGRPQRDKESTLRWLEKYGMLNRVWFNQGRPEILRDVIQTKVAAIRSLNIIRFYESDPLQVNIIQQEVPESSIIWWSNNK